MPWKCKFKKDYDSETAGYMTVRWFDANDNEICAYRDHLDTDISGEVTAFVAAALNVKNTCDGTTAANSAISAAFSAVINAA